MNPVKCPVSDSSNVTTFLTLDQIPVFCNVLHETKEAALAAPTATMRLSYCADSGHVFNSAFDPDLVAYSGAYENSLHFSETFQKFAMGLADRLINQYGIRQAKVIDVGCGDGHFLNLVCERGSNEGLGFDPSYDGGSESNLIQGVSISSESFSASAGEYSADLITCRHVLEHIEEPHEFVRGILAALTPKTDPVFYFEVPNVRHTLERMAIWDLIYEHCSYYSSESIRQLFESEGLEVLAVEDVYGGQFLSLDARLTSKHGKCGKAHGEGDDNREELTRTVASFKDGFQKKVELWRETLRPVDATGAAAENVPKTLLWGAGSKGITILNILGVYTEVEYIVDINPRKHGKFVPGTGQEIVSPDFMLSYKPDVVVVMNGIYADEITHSLKQLGLSPEILVA